MDRTSGIDQLNPGYMRWAQNVRFTPNGEWYTRKGFTKRYTHSTVGGFAIKALELPDYQALFVHMGTKILVTQDGTNFYDTGNTRSAVYSTLFDIGQNILHINKTDSDLRIATSRTIATVLFGAVVIRFDPGDTTNFTAAGTIYIQGNAISYTSIDTASAEFRGVTGVPVGGFTSTNLIITQNTVLTGKPKGTAIAELQGSTLIADRTDFPEIVSYSTPATEANPEYSWDFVTVGAGSKKLRQAITALFSSKNVTLIGHIKSISYATGFGGVSGTSLLTDTLHSSDGVPNQKCITDMDGMTIINAINRFIPVVMSQQGGVRILDDELNKNKNMDYAISADLKNADYDVTYPFIHYADKQRELICGVTINGSLYHYVFSPDSRSWSVDTGKPFTAMADFKKRTFAISQYTDDIYEDYVGSNDDDLPIHSIVETGHHTQNFNLTTSDFTNIIHSGKISNVGSYKFKIIIDGDIYHEEEINADTLRSQGLMLDSFDPGGTGTSNIGGDPLTNDLQITTPSRFVLPYEILLTGENIQLVWEVLNKDTYLEVGKYAINSETEGELEISNF
jgi:hypothetical protein